MVRSTYRTFVAVMLAGVMVATGATGVTASPAPPADAPAEDDTERPGAPRDFRAFRSIQENGINVAWTRSTDNTGIAEYRIYDGGIYLFSVGPDDVNTTFAVDGGTRFIQMDAVDLAGNVSVRTAPAIVIFGGQANVPAAPVGVTAESSVVDGVTQTAVRFRLPHPQQVGTCTLFRNLGATNTGRFAPEPDPNDISQYLVVDVDTPPGPGYFQLTCTDNGTNVSVRSAPAFDDVVAPPTDGCSQLDDRACLLPWPNNEFTVADDTTPTGLRLDLPAEGGPLNTSGVPIDFTDQNRADGFSPGSALLTSIPDVDLALSGVPNSLDIGASITESTPITLTNVDTGERHPYWAELDAQAPVGDQLLKIHPAVAFDEGATYSVTIDALVNASGEPVAADLPMQWEFTIASAESLSSRLLHIREVAYEQLDGAAPSFTIGEVTEANGVRTVEGTFDIPNFLTGDGGPGNSFLLGEDGMPMQSTEAPTYPARFRCVFGTASASSVVLYGHGLLGSRGEVNFFAQIADLLAGCATDWIGMAREDVPTVLEILGDQSRFNEQADRLQQGHLAFQLLGILVNQPDGFASDPAFQTDDGAPLITNENTTFLGNSQGGILGGATSAISTEWDRAALGVPAMNYSLLLTRSTDWPVFQLVYDQAYPDPVDRVLGIQTSQLLWDRGENQGYAQHITADPYDGFDAKPVLLIGAFGDHQVANVATDVLARTIGAEIHRPALAEGRSAQVDPYWGIPAIGGPSTTESAYVMWDYGTGESPADNLPPDPAIQGLDPHGAGSEEPGVLAQALLFLATGQLVVGCDGPCIGRQIDQE